jgi:hypothetical protein
MSFIRLVVFGFIALSIIYLSISVYSRSIRREKLEKTYDADPVEGLSRVDYVNQGIAEYNASIRPKLIGLVFVIPPAIVATIVYVTNAN